MFQHLHPGASATISRLDKEHSDTLEAYNRMGRPQYPSHAQVEKLREVAKVPGGEEKSLSGNSLSIAIPPQGLALIELH